MSSIHQRAKDVFLEALARPAAERGVFVAGACGEDAALLQEVESLLEFHDDEDELETGQELGHDVFAPGEVFDSRYRLIALQTESLGPTVEREHRAIAAAIAARDAALATELMRAHVEATLRLVEQNAALR